MKPLTFSKNSWHYRLVYFIKGNCWSNDFCSYFWEVVGSLVWAIFCFCLVLLTLSFTIIFPLTYLIVGLQYGFFKMPNEVIAGLIMDIGFIIITVAFYIVEDWIPQYQERKRTKHYEEFVKNGYKHIDKEPSFIVQSYHKFKDKTCVKVEFK